jgi:5-methylcytosine-specific restriction enzyme A
MAHGGAGDRRVWDDWAHRPEELAQAVALIRARGETDEAPADTGEDEEYEAPEGRILFREHRRYERDRKLVAKKKAAVLRKTGRLACEVCDFESTEAYDLEGVIDVHHVIPLHKIGESVTTMSDLALVCPTCHRVLHKHRPVITPAELRAKRVGQ